ncbi:hypothetical protein MFM001_16410 [Mycobacterium sp. MFM001]|uniref:hypothetical protein n=1 Tax=Mycobacterium sp. MFM001 TaxID=2049453 RepID=UPI000DA4364D|nr:hypothetical protein [Mycobacterium sp. MFM001]GBE65179.1 hypothetical protein MFM001_16410 [Mycobacterium sp. MFM001]
MRSPEDAEFIDFGDEDNQMHITNKGVSLVELEQVFFDERRFVPNKKPGRNAPFLMVGRTKANRPITAAVLYDEIRLAVIPISARNSEDWEINKWKF